MTKADVRRSAIVDTLRCAKDPISGTELAQRYSVSRQIIVSDIAALKSQGFAILSTNRGYLLTQPDKAFRVFKVRHTGAEMEAELNAIVQRGGFAQDIFIVHSIYGRLSADLLIGSAEDVGEFIARIASSGDKPLSSAVTDRVHYHTVYAESEQVLDQIEAALSGLGFLA